MTIEQRLDKAVGLLTRALVELHAMADKAGDVPEWNEGGDLFELSREIRRFLGGRWMERENKK